VLQAAAISYGRLEASCRGGSGLGPLAPLSRDISLMEGSQPPTPVATDHEIERRIAQLLWCGRAGWSLDALAGERESAGPRFEARAIGA
jgi:hypothetical protein